jgi:hypothetical protein
MDLVNTLAPSGPGSGFHSSVAWQPRDLSTILRSYVGSGGVRGIEIPGAGGTGLTIVREESVPNDVEAPEPVATSDRVLLIRRWLSLSIAEAARVLFVQRPTVYAWERGDVPGKKNAERIRAVFELASHWRAISEEPLGGLRKELLGTRNGKSLVDLLSEARLRVDTIKSAMTVLLAMRTPAQASRPLSGAELAQRFGFRPLTAQDAARNIEREARGAPGWQPDKA